MAKYKNRKTIVNGITFDSAKEARRYSELVLLEKAGVINTLKLQPSFKIVVNGVKICTYRADFSYTENGKFVVEDVKGFKTRIYGLKKKLLLATHGIEIREV